MEAGARAPTCPSWRARQPYPGHRMTSEAPQVWTATRCNRLLRPLVSHIAALRKHITKDGLYSAGDHMPASTASPEQPPEQPDHTAGSLSRSRINQTYSRKGRKSRNVPMEPATEQVSLAVVRLRRNLPRKATLPGEISLPTPILKRARTFELSSPLQQPSLERDDGVKKSSASLSIPSARSGRSALEEEIVFLRQNVLPCRFTLYESIYRALDALIMATSLRETTTSSRSLLSMCLRKVPTYIAELEQWEKAQAEETGTKSMIDGLKSSFEIYGDLESLGPAHNGWKHLRTVVRAHGIDLVKRAITEGLLEMPFSLLLIKLCNQSGAHLEAEELLQTLLQQKVPELATSPRLSDRIRQRSLLNATIQLPQESGRRLFAMRQMTSLLLNKHLPVEWLHTKDCDTLWSAAAKTLAGSGPSEDAAEFTIQAIISLTNELGPFNRSLHNDELISGLQHALISVLAAIAAMAILCQETSLPAPQPYAKQRRTNIPRRVEFILSACFERMRRLEGKKRLWLKHVVLLTTIFAACNRQTERGAARTEMLKTLWQQACGRGRYNEKQQLYRSTVTLVCALAHCCGRGASSPSHKYLLNFCSQLEDLGLPGDPFKGVQVDAAFSLAERTNDVRDLVLAESLGSKETATTTHPAPRPTYTGYRWEDGIGEWVTASPDQATRSMECELQDISDDDGSVCTFASTMDSPTISRQGDDSYVTIDSSPPPLQQEPFSLPIAEADRAILGSLEIVTRPQKRPHKRRLIASTRDTVRGRDDLVLHQELHQDSSANKCGPSRKRRRARAPLRDTSWQNVSPGRPAELDSEDELGR